jgi:hypothetical protein
MAVAPARFSPRPAPVANEGPGPGAPPPSGSGRLPLTIAREIIRSNLVGEGDAQRLDVPAIVEDVKALFTTETRGIISSTVALMNLMLLDTDRGELGLALFEALKTDLHQLGYIAPLGLRRMLEDAGEEGERARYELDLLLRAAGAVAVDDHLHNGEEAKERGQQLAGELVRGEKDVAAVVAAVMPFISFREHTEAEGGVLVRSVLDALPAARRAELAGALVGALPFGLLMRMSRSGVEGLEQALAAGGPTMAKAHGMVQQALSERPARTEQDIQGVKLIGEGLSEETLSGVPEELAKLTAVPEVAAALRGLSIIIAPRAERLSDQEDIFLREGRHDAISAEGPLAETRGFFTPRGNYIAFTEQRLWERGDELGVLRHEMTHAVDSKYLSRLAADRPELRALLLQDVQVTDQTGDGVVSGGDVIATAFTQRRETDPDHFFTVEYARRNRAEWLAMSAEDYFNEPAVLKERDPALYALLDGLYGPGRS